MRILFLSHFVPYPPHGGALQRNYNLIRQVALSHKIDLLTFTQQKLLPSPAKLHHAAEAVRGLFGYMKIMPVPTDGSRWRWYLLLFGNLFSLRPYSVWRFRSREMSVEIRSRLAAQSYDLVHIDTIALAPYAADCASVPVVLHHHNIESSLMLRRAGHEKNPLVKFYLYLQGRKLRRLERIAAAAAAVNVVVSDLDKAELLAISPTARVETIANGTDTEYFTPRDLPQSQSLIYAGGMTWYPNVDAMVYFCATIFPLIKQASPGVVLNVIGRYPPPEIIRLGEIDPAVRVLGYVDDVRVPVAEAAVYVVPIRIGGGTRLKILDAMAMGKAIVSTTIGAEGLDLTDGRDIILADSPEAFAQAVVELLHIPDRRRLLAASARATVEAAYAWSVIGPQLIAVYAGICKPQ